MKIKVITVDHDKSKQFINTISEYCKRTAWNIKIIDVQAKKHNNPIEQRKLEGLEIKKHLSQNEYTIALDPKGKMLTSEEIAQNILKLQQESTNHLAFIIGGAFGLPQEIKNNANITLSLGLITMPHRIAKLVLIEQIYRAYTIISNHPYHK